jgi:hypothetical protein
MENWWFFMWLKQCHVYHAFSWEWFLHKHGGTIQLDGLMI